MTKTSKNIGELLRTGRQMAGLTQGELAAKLGYKSSQFISNWEREFSQVPLNTVIRLTRILPIKTEDVVEALIAASQTDLEKALLNRARRHR